MKQGCGTGHTHTHTHSLPSSLYGLTSLSLSRPAWALQAPGSMSPPQLSHVPLLLVPLGLHPSSLTSGCLHRGRGEGGARGSLFSCRTVAPHPEEGSWSSSFYRAPHPQLPGLVQIETAIHGLLCVDKPPTPMVGVAVAGPQVRGWGLEHRALTWNPSFSPRNLGLGWWQRKALSLPGSLCVIASDPRLSREWGVVELGVEEGKGTGDCEVC